MSTERLRLLDDQEKMSQEIQAGLDQLDVGIRIEASQVYAEARRRIQAIQRLAGEQPIGQTESHGCEARE